MHPIAALIIAAAFLTIPAAIIPAEDAEAIEYSNPGASIVSFTVDTEFLGGYALTDADGGRCPIEELPTIPAHYRWWKVPPNYNELTEADIWAYPYEVPADTHLYVWAYYGEDKLIKDDEEDGAGIEYTLAAGIILGAAAAGGIAIIQHRRHVRRYPRF